MQDHLQHFYALQSNGKKNTISYIREQLCNAVFIEKHKSMPVDFTRSRKLSFFSVFTLVLRNSVKSLQLMLNEFFLQTKQDSTITASAFTQARKKLKHTAFTELNEGIISIYYDKASIQKRLGFRILGFDGSKLTLPNTAEIRDVFGSKAIGNHTEQDLGNYSQATFETCYDVLNNIAVQSRLTAGTGYEVDSAMEMLDALRDDDLAIFDRGYAAYIFFAALIKKKKHYLIRCPRSSFAAVQAMFEPDGPVSMTVLIDVPYKHKKQAKKLSLPATIKTRLIKVVLSTGETEVLATSLTDESTFPTEVFPELYFLRWGVETFFSKLKGRLALENFTGKSVESIRQDFWSTIFLSNLETIVTEDVEINMNAETKAEQLNKKINKAVSFNTIKNLAFDIFSLETDIEQIIFRLTQLFTTGSIVVRKDRKVPRYKISATQSLNFQKRTRKHVF